MISQYEDSYNRRQELRGGLEKAAAIIKSLWQAWPPSEPNPFGEAYAAIEEAKRMWSDLHHGGSFPVRSRLATAKEHARYGSTYVTHQRVPGMAFVGMDEEAADDI